MLVTFGGQGGCRSHYVVRRQFYGLLRLPIRYLPICGAPDGSRTRIISAWRADAMPIRRLVHKPVSSVSFVSHITRKRTSHFLIALAQPTRLERALPLQVGKLSRLLSYHLLHDCIFGDEERCRSPYHPWYHLFSRQGLAPAKFPHHYKWHSKQDSNLHSPDPESDALPVMLFEYL